MTLELKPAKPSTENAPKGGELRPDRKFFIVALRCGRLANRLILFANLIALAEEQRHRLINSTFHSYARFFKTTCRDNTLGRITHRPRVL